MANVESMPHHHFRVTPTRSQLCKIRIDGKLIYRANLGAIRAKALKKAEEHKAVWTCQRYVIRAPSSGVANRCSSGQCWSFKHTVNERDVYLQVSQKRFFLKQKLVLSTAPRLNESDYDVIMLLQNQRKADINILKPLSHPGKVLVAGLAANRANPHVFAQNGTDVISNETIFSRASVTIT